MTPVTIEEGPSHRLESSDDGTTTLVVTGSWRVEIDDLLETGRIDKLDLNYAKGFKTGDLGRLRSWPVQRLSLLARTVKDLRPIEVLAPSLQSLSVQTSSDATLDLSPFTSLAHLSAEWEQIRLSIKFAPQLKELVVRRYSEPDLDSLEFMSRLTRLQFMDRSNLQTLEGIRHFRSLTNLDISLAPIRDLEPIRTSGLKLRELQVESCKISDLEPLCEQNQLVFVNASELGSLLSIGALRDLHNLEVLWMFGSTNVLDNDLRPLTCLTALKELRMRSRASYFPSLKSIQGSIAQRFDGTQNDSR